MKKTVFFCIILLITASIAPIRASLTIIENEDQFNKAVNANTPSVVVFSTEWCPACKLFKAPLEKVANDPAFANIAFIKVDTDKFNTIANKHHIRGLPTTQFIQAGHQKKEITGAQSEKELKDIITATFGDKAETKREATAPQPAESAGPFQMVLNLVANILIAIKDLIVNLLDSVISFIRNLFSSK